MLECLNSAHAMAMAGNLIRIQPLQTQIKLKLMNKSLSVTKKKLNFAAWSFVVGCQNIWGEKCSWLRRTKRGCFCWQSISLGANSQRRGKTPFYPSSPFAKGGRALLSVPLILSLDAADFCQVLSSLTTQNRSMWFSQISSWGHISRESSVACLRWLNKLLTGEKSEFTQNRVILSWFSEFGMEFGDGKKVCNWKQQEKKKNSIAL